jgi:putative Mg2+ transporter-C (MgtC) family protein
VILRDGVNVRGINTAATIWCSAAVGVLAGAGYLPQAVIAAALVVLVHVGLRPAARRIDRLPAAPDSEVQTLYRFRVVCRSDDEAHIRASVAQALSGGQFVLTALRSEDLDSGTGRVEVIAELQRLGRDDIGLESAVSRLSLEPGVSAVTWSVVEPDVPLAPQED